MSTVLLRHREVSLEESIGILRMLIEKEQNTVIKGAFENAVVCIGEAINQEEVRRVAMEQAQALEVEEGEEGEEGDGPGPPRHRQVRGHSAKGTSDFMYG